MDHVGHSEKRLRLRADHLIRYRRSDSQAEQLYLLLLVRVEVSHLTLYKTFLQALVFLLVLHTGPVTMVVIPEEIHLFAFCLFLATVFYPPRFDPRVVRHRFRRLVRI